MGELPDIIGAALLVLGTAFCMLGIYGVVRLSNIYNRLHAAGMVITLGAGAILLSPLFLVESRAGLKGLATALFLMLTAPLVTHTLARTAYRLRLPLGAEAIRDDLAEDEEAGAG